MAFNQPDTLLTVLHPLGGLRASEVSLAYSSLTQSQSSDSPHFCNKGAEHKKGAKLLAWSHRGINWQFVPIASLCSAIMSLVCKAWVKTGVVHGHALLYRPPLWLHFFKKLINVHGGQRTFMVVCSLLSLCKSWGLNLTSFPGLATNPLPTGSSYWPPVALLIQHSIATYGPIQLGVSMFQHCSVFVWDSIYLRLNLKQTVTVYSKKLISILFSSCIFWGLPPYAFVILVFPCTQKQTFPPNKFRWNQRGKRALILTWLWIWLGGESPRFLVKHTFRRACWVFPERVS